MNLMPIGGGDRKRFGFARGGESWVGTLLRSYVSDLRKLRWLDLRETGISESALQMFRRAQPKCHVER